MYIDSIFNNNRGDFFLNACELTTFISTLANVLAQKLDDEELELFASATVQLGDTLETISAQREYQQSKCCQNRHND